MLKKICISLITGFLIALTCPAVWGLSFLFPLSLIFYWKLVDDYKFSQIWWTPIALSWSLNWALYFWAPVALTEMWKFPLIVSLGLWSPIALLSEIQWFLLLIFIKYFDLKLKKLDLMQIMLISSFYAGLESLFRFLFPDDIGVALYEFKYLRQVLDLSSTSLLSFLYIFTNIVIYQVWQNKKYFSFKTLSLVCLLIGGNLYGVYRINQINQEEKSEISIGIIQPNVHHKERESSRLGVKNTAEHLMNTQYKLTDQIIYSYPNAEMIIWPETTFPFLFKTPTSQYEKQVEDKLIEYVNNKDFYLVFGSFGRTGDNLTSRNNIYLLKNNDYINHFEKTILFPFGEYLPFRKYLPWLEKFFPNIHYTEPSLKQTVHQIEINNKKINTTASICYEVLFSDKFRNSAKLNSQLMFNVSNESWFLSWGEPQISLMMTAVRATETKIPVVRSANTGHSAFILPDGSIKQQQPMNKQSWIFDKVQVSKEVTPTFFTLYGDWFSKLGLWLGLLWSIQLWYQKRK